MADILDRLAASIPRLVETGRTRQHLTHPAHRGSATWLKARDDDTAAIAEFQELVRECENLNLHMEARTAVSFAHEARKEACRTFADAVK